MKHLPLKSVMLGLNIIRRDDGYELASPAGTAWYDASGVRGKVEGIPEYFPERINFTDELTSSAGSKKLKVADAEGQVRATFGSLTDCSKKQESKVSTLKLNVELDTSDVQKILDDIDKKIQGCDAFKNLNSSKREGTVTNTYHIKVDCNGRHYAAGMGVGVGDSKDQAQFLAGETYLNDAFINPDTINTAKNQDKPGNVNSTVNITDDGDATLKKAMQEAAERGAIEGAKLARQELLKDFQHRGPLRRILGI